LIDGSEFWNLNKIRRLPGGVCCVGSNGDVSRFVSCGYFVMFNHIAVGTAFFCAASISGRVHARAPLSSLFIFKRTPFAMATTELLALDQLLF
jgi:hypothetical protein